MKIDRQLGILSILLQKESVTAPYLSEMFEVSRRTINRDIEDLCKAGIPIVTRQGANGGISIIDGYKIDKTMLTHDEMQDILAGLRIDIPMRIWIGRMRKVVLRENMNQQIHPQQVLWKIFTEDRK